METQHLKPPYGVQWEVRLAVCRNISACLFFSKVSNLTIGRADGVVPPPPFRVNPPVPHATSEGVEQAAELGLRLRLGQGQATAERRVPAGTSIVWHPPPSCTWGGGLLRGPADAGLLECLTPGSGCRAGVARAKAMQTPALAAATSPRSFAARVLTVMQAVGSMEDGLIGLQDGEVLQYAALKRSAAPAYVEAWAHLRTQLVFAGWIEKPSTLFEFDCRKNN